MECEDWVASRIVSVEESDASNGLDSRSTYHVLDAFICPNVRLNGSDNNDGKVLGALVLAYLIHCACIIVVR